MTSVLIALAASENQDMPAAEASRFNQELPASEVIQKKDSSALVPLGTVFGIKLYTDGVIVTGLTSVNASEGPVCPAAIAGIKAGDYITAVNGTDVADNEAFLKAMEGVSEYPVTLTLRRGDKTMDTELTPVADGGFMRCGMWIRDSAAGIGTLTYYNPADGSFGGLGHGICDVDTKTVMDLKFGEPAGIRITDVIEAGKNEPGKICGYFDGEGSMGELADNKDTGIYGKLAFVPEGEAIPTASKDEVTTGKAEIISTLDDSGPKPYTINIDRICSPNRRTKNFIIRVTDKELLERTGGIVQGMSGSPIIQDGKLVGAVTHVLLNDPSRGYGIFIDNMLDDAA